MKRMVYDLVKEVRSSPSSSRISFSDPISKISKPKTATKVEISDSDCPKCKKGKMIKGKTGYGCSRWKEGCKFLIPNEFLGKKLPIKQQLRLYQKQSTTLLKNFIENGEKVNGRVVLNENFELLFQIQQEPEIKPKDSKLSCPKCSKGEVIKGKVAFGCSRWNQGCDFQFSFTQVKEIANGKEMTKDLVREILKSS